MQKSIAITQTMELVQDPSSWLRQLWYELTVWAAAWGRVASKIQPVDLLVCRADDKWPALVLGAGLWCGPVPVTNISGVGQQGLKAQ